MTIHFVICTPTVIAAATVMGDVQDAQKTSRICALPEIVPIVRISAAVQTDVRVQMNASAYAVCIWLNHRK